MRTKVIVTAGGPFGMQVQRKWQIDGLVSIAHDLKSAKVSIKDGGAFPSIVVLATCHELGHVEYFEDLVDGGVARTTKDIADVPVWQTEVDAWLRGIDGMNSVRDPLAAPELVTEFLTYSEGTFVLDCLNTYRWGQGIAVNEWLEAKELIAERCAEPEKLMQYEPERPPPDEGPPSPSFEFLPEGVSPMDLPDEPGEHEGGHVPYTPNPKAAEQLGRWEVLVSPEVIQAAQQLDRAGFIEFLRKRGLDTSLDDIPPVLEALL